jgi:hypothetical protein
MSIAPIDAATLPPFSNHRAICSQCGARWEIRVHFDRGCEIVRGGDHFHGSAAAVMSGSSNVKKAAHVGAHRSVDSTCACHQLFAMRAGRLPPVIST